MPAQDTSEIKEKIISLFKNNGPSLPVHVAKETGLSILFASAFLSELIAEKKIKTSSLRVGSSPLYLIPGQESLLENFSSNLKSKEKEAFDILKEKGFLNDNEQEPAIRVALRSIKDFAIPFEKNNEIIWRYFKLDEPNFKNEPEIKKEPETEENPEEIKPEEKVEIKTEEKEKKLDIFEEKNTQTKTAIKKPSKRTKPNEKFLEKVKEFLSKSSVEITNIEGIKKEELLLRVKINGEEQLLVAYNKKKIGEKEIIDADKKASELNLKYSILSLGNLPKKILNLIKALENMKDIGKVE